MTKSAPASARLRSSSAVGREVDAAPARDLAAELLHELQPFGVEIVQHDVGVGQRRRVGEVAQEARRPVVAAAADDHDARAHARSLRSRSVVRRAARPRPRSRPRRRAAARRRRSPNGCAGRRRRTRRRAAGSRRRRRPAAATKPGARRDEAEHGEHALDAIELTELGVQHRQRVQRAPARRLRPLLDREVVAEHARIHEHAVVVARELTRRARPAAVHDDRVERIVRRVRPGQRQARARRAGRRSCSQPPLEEGRRLGAVPHVAAVEHVVHERVVGRAELRVDARAATRPSRAPASTGKIMSSIPFSASSGRGAIERRDVEVLDRADLTGHDLRAAHVPRDRVRRSPRRQVARRRSRRAPARRSRRGTACTSRRTTGRRRPSAPGRRAGARASTSSARWRSQRLRSMRHDAVHRGAHEIPVAVVLVVGHPVGPLAEAAQVGREHDVALAREHVRVRRAFVVLLVEQAADARLARDRGRGSRASPGPGSVRSCGTRRYAGNRHRRLGVEHDAVAPVGAAVDRLGRLEIERHRLGRAGRASSSSRSRTRARHGSSCAGEVVERARVGVDRGLVAEPPVRPVGEVAPPCSPSRSRRVAERPAETAREMAQVRRRLPRAREVTEARREHPPVALARSTTRAGSRTSAGARRARARSSSPSRTRSSTCASGRRSRNWYTSSCQLPLGAEMRARRMRRVEHVGDERLRPRMAVEAGADELAVLVPAVTRVGRGVDRAAPRAVRRARRRGSRRVARRSTASRRS